MSKEGINMIGGDSSVCVSQDSYDAIMCAAGSGIQAVDMILNNEATKIFCNIRPPGHHAHRGHGEGFCIFNNVMIAANYASKHYKVAIIDWDVHHGNGTESLINRENDQDEDLNILLINIQQSFHTIWPGTGKNNLSNYNLSPGEGDYAVKELFKMIIPRLEKYQPELFIISCGFDAHREDKIAQLNYTSKLYGWMTKKLLKICPNMISMLEGGYDMEALSESVVCHVNALIKID